MGNIFIEELNLTNILSFGPDSKPLNLGPLNILIGPNGSGKSNFLEAINLLRASSKNFSAPVKESGGVKEWLWKSAKNPEARIEAILHNEPKPDISLRHSISFTEHVNRFEVTSEKIENKEAYSPLRNTTNIPFRYYSNENGYIKLKDNSPFSEDNKERILEKTFINPERSVLSQILDQERYPVLWYISEKYNRIKIYRDWVFGRYSPQRLPQRTDLEVEYLSENCENLGLVLNYLKSRVKSDILEQLSNINPDYNDFNIQIVSGFVQLFLEEKNYSIPSTRLSDGTLRYLCLIAILLHPDPPPLICIEEPELGLHPDILPSLANMLKKASEKSQLIVTTHSDILIDAFSDTPESVIICEKHNQQISMKRLDKASLEHWLDKYRLGELWMKGELGGTIW